MKELQNKIWKRKDKIGSGNLRVDECVKMLTGTGVLLDIGSGATNLAELVDYNVINVDISENALKNSGAIGTLNDTNQGLSFSDNSVNAVVCLDVIDYIFDPEQLIKEIKRVLKKNGEFVVSFPNIRNINQIISLMKGRGPKTSGDAEGWDGGHIHYFTSRDILELLVKAGFEIVAVKGLFDRKLKRRYFFGDRMTREFFAGGIIIKAVKK